MYGVVEWTKERSFLAHLIACTSHVVLLSHRIFTRRSSAFLPEESMQQTGRSLAACPTVGVSVELAVWSCYTMIRRNRCNGLNGWKWMDKAFITIVVSCICLQSSCSMVTLSIVLRLHCAFPLRSPKYHTLSKSAPACLLTVRSTVLSS
jgi:hypothetical protein